MNMTDKTPVTTSLSARRLRALNYFGRCLACVAAAIEIVVLNAAIAGAGGRGGHQLLRREVDPRTKAREGILREKGGRSRLRGEDRAVGLKEGARVHAGRVRREGLVADLAQVAPRDRVSGCRAVEGGLKAAIAIGGSLGSRERVALLDDVTDLGEVLEPGGADSSAGPCEREGK